MMWHDVSVVCRRLCMYVYVCMYVCQVHTGKPRCNEIVLESNTIVFFDTIPLPVQL